MKNKTYDTVTVPDHKCWSKPQNYYGIPPITQLNQTKFLLEDLNVPQYLTDYQFNDNINITTDVSKFNIDIDFYEEQSSKLFWEDESLYATVRHEDYSCPDCEQELMYNHKDDFMYCPSCTEGYKNG